MADRIAGTIRSFDADGNKYTIGEGTFSTNISGRKRTPIPGTGDYKEELTNTFIKGDVLTTKGLKTKDITEAAGQTIQLEAANGSTYGLNNATYTGDPEIDASEGKVPVEFSAGPDDGFELPG